MKRPILNQLERLMVVKHPYSFSGERLIVYLAHLHFLRSIEQTWLFSFMQKCITKLK